MKSILIFQFPVFYIFFSFLKKDMKYSKVLANQFLVDDFSSMFVILTLLLCFVTNIEEKSSTKNWLANTFLYFMSFFLFMLFMTKSWLVFFLTFELSVYFTLLLILLWGVQPERFSASMYFMVYSIMGSFPLLLKILYWEGYQWGILSYKKLPSKVVSLYESNLFMFLFCYLGLFLKLPMYGGHLWLPKAHVEAPSYGSMLLAALLLKIGVYGMLRVKLSSVLSSNTFGSFLMLWGLVSLVFSGFVCFRKTDLKGLMAYSSMAHMNMLVVAVFYLKNWLGISFLLLSLGHGFISSKMFSGFNQFYGNSQSRKIHLNFGFTPMFWLPAFLWMLSCAGKSSLPPSMNMFAEYGLILNLVNNYQYSAVFFVLSVFISGLFSMHLFLLCTHKKFVKTLVFSNKIKMKFCLFLSVFMCFFLFFFFY